MVFEAQEFPWVGLGTSIIAAVSVDPFVKVAYYVHKFDGCHPLIELCGCALAFWLVGVILTIATLIWSYLNDQAAAVPPANGTDPVCSGLGALKLIGAVFVFVGLFLSSVVTNVPWTGSGDCPDYKPPTIPPLCCCNSTQPISNCSNPVVPPATPCCQWFPTDWSPPRNDSACLPSVAFTRNITCQCDGVTQQSNTSCLNAPFPPDFNNTKEWHDEAGGCTCGWMYGAWSSCENGLERRSYACGYLNPTPINGNQYTILCNAAKCNSTSPNATQPC